LLVPVGTEDLLDVLQMVVGGETVALLFVRSLGWSGGLGRPTGRVRELVRVRVPSPPRVRPALLSYAEERGLIPPATRAMEQ